MAAGYGSAGLSSSTPWDPAPDPYEGVRFIDPRVRDYVRQSDGTFQRMTAAKQKVILAVVTLLDSAAGIPGFGAKFPDYLDENFERAAKRAVRQAVMHLEGTVIRLTGVSVDVEGGSAGRADIVVEWTDLSTDERDRARF